MECNAKHGLPCVVSLNGLSLRPPSGMASSPGLKDCLKVKTRYRPLCETLFKLEQGG